MKVLIDQSTRRFSAQTAAASILILLIHLQWQQAVAADVPQVANNKTSRANSTLRLDVAPTNQDNQRNRQLGGNCAAKSSCKTRGRRLELDGGSDKRPCYCDARCAQYDDCCADSPFARPADKRSPAEALAARADWHCHRVNPIFGDILLRASCSAQWLASAPSKREADATKTRCEYMRNLRPGRRAPAEQEADPVGMMMPITDLTSGITYANSYCLRCNRLATPAAATNARAKLIYWSPMLECNYNLDSDDRNSLFDLISANKGQALHFSAKQNKWLIDVGRQQQQQQQQQQPQNKSERVCSITPTIPDSVEHMVRFCRANTIATCPKSLNGTLAHIIKDCELGHQSLTYGQTTNLVYRNLACATCNNDTNVFCEPRLKKTFPGGPVIKVVVDKQQPDRVIHPPAQDEPPASDDEMPADLSGKGAGRGGHSSGAAISGSFSVLLDLYGTSQGDEQVGAIHSCPDPANQVYDPFYLTCRDIVCGLHHQMMDGNCVPVREPDRERGSLVEKFEPAMAHVTTVCLLVSIASLSMYLFLYALSMFDLRPLLVDMAQWERLNHNPLDEQRGSKASMSSSRSQTQSHNLSSRGVACLAASLLAAYLLFIVGHQQAEETDQTDSPALGCRATAVATYYFFLVAFTWMFVLSYDIWRILRLATCQLRGPALHPQTGRFLVYTLFTQFTAGLIVAGSVLIDVAPIKCANINSTSCSPFEQQLSLFIHTYRPKFGHHLGSCWFSNRRSLALFFGLPVALIMLSNVVFFVHSSYMVIRTSSSSSKKLKSGKSSPTASINSPQPRLRSDTKHHPPIETSISSISAHFATMKQQQQQLNQDQSNSSAQTLESHLSEESSGGEESPQPQVPQLHQPQLIPDAPSPKHKHRLEQSQSSGSLATNHSVASGSSSLTANLALKYDAHLQTLGSLMSSIMKDYRLYCRLSTIMGLTWLTGLMASIVDQSATLWYLFVVLNTLQGLFIFIAFGCKRSKLTNLEILIDYVRFSFRRQKQQNKKQQAGKQDDAT